MYLSRENSAIVVELRIYVFNPPRKSAYDEYSSRKIEIQRVGALAIIRDLTDDNAD